MLCKEKVEVRSAIDGMWRLCKESVPTSLRSREGDGTNPNIMKFIRQWQWRWHQNKDVLTKLGQKLSHRLMMMLEDEKAHLFSHETTVS